ncbi:hypothetical protein M422DRAFT_277163, partial [Sphaerobolus stellatus SS14]
MRAPKLYAPAAFLLPIVLLPVLICPVNAAGRGFSFTSPPTQCKNATLQFAGDKPVSFTDLIIIPIGTLHPETRRITWIAINSTGSGYTFPITYPGNSSFVISTIDTAGFSNTTFKITVEPSDDASCLNSTQTVPDFTFSVDPPAPTQACPFNIEYRNGSKAAKPPVTFVGLVPG